MAGRLKAQHAIGEWIASVMIEKQPAIEAGFLYFALDGFKVHA
jgi:hypothetical protein